VLTPKLDRLKRLSLLLPQVLGEDSSARTAETEKVVSGGRREAGEGVEAVMKSKRGSPAVEEEQGVSGKRRGVSEGVEAVVKSKVVEEGCWVERKKERGGSRRGARARRGGGGGGIGDQGNSREVLAAAVVR